METVCLEKTRNPKIHMTQKTRLGLMTKGYLKREYHNIVGVNKRTSRKFDTW